MVVGQPLLQSCRQQQLLVGIVGKVGLAHRRLNWFDARPISRVPGSGVRVRRCRKANHRVILVESQQPNRRRWSPSNLLELLRRGIDGDGTFWGSPAGPGDGINAEVSADRRPARPAQSGSLAATATATAPGIGPWSCTFPSCGKAATSPACWNHGGAARRLCCR